MRQRWMYVTVTVIFAITGLFIARLRLSDIPDLAVGHSTKPPAVGQPRVRSVVYEVDGPDGTTVAASYIDAEGVSRASHVRLPWTFRLTSNQLTFPAGVTASSDAADVSCQVVIDGAVRAARKGTSVVECQVPVS